MIDRIKNRLDDYLGFNSNKLFYFTIPNGLIPKVRIFGGAIRDSIADLHIHDIDILCAPTSAIYIADILIDNGYKFFPSLNPKDLASVYTEIRIINEPHTYIKDDRIVQLIRPNHFNDFNKIVREVDISCCGISYDASCLYENVENAILHCEHKVYEVTNGKMNTIRLMSRMDKLDRRGWSKIEKFERRNISLDRLLEANSDNYIREWLQ